MQARSRSPSEAHDKRLKLLRWETLYSVARTYAHLVAMSTKLKDPMNIAKYSGRFWDAAKELEALAPQVDLSPNAYTQLIQLFSFLPGEVLASCSPERFDWAEFNGAPLLHEPPAAARKTKAGTLNGQSRPLEMDRKLN